MLAHRYLAEQALGRPLLPREVVHHKDGDSLNNDLSNLIVLPSQRVHAHAEFHLRRVKSGMPSLFPEVFQVIPSDTYTWGTLFAHIVVWQGQEPPLRRRLHRAVETKPQTLPPSLFPLHLEGHRELELVIPDLARGMTTLGELLGHILVQPIGEAEEECFSLRNNRLGDSASSAVKLV
ncbi:HNH endonuclease [Deinococcus sp. VB343]|uniref:HNH endonuclease n=1 Tax=Deinococcus sp. VB343 TaxID=3385567 RepID=UPI0039C9CF69